MAKPLAREQFQGNVLLDSTLWVWLGVRLKLCLFRSELHGRPLELFMCSVLKRQGYGEGFRWGPNFLLLLLCCLQWRIFPFVTVVFNNIFSGGFHNIWTNLSRRQHCFWYRFWMREGGVEHFGVSNFDAWWWIFCAKWSQKQQPVIIPTQWECPAMIQQFTRHLHCSQIWFVKTFTWACENYKNWQKTNLLGEKAISQKNNSYQLTILSCMTVK